MADRAFHPAAATNGNQDDVRLVAIDGLRAFAVAQVFLVHALPEYFPGGFLGVDLFFVISGFVITRSLLADRPSLGRFYYNRFLRIVPPALALLGGVTVLAATGYRLARFDDVLLALFALMNWARAFGFVDVSLVGHFWSLSIEEQFYLTLPAIVLVLREKPSATIRLVMTGLAALALAWCLFMTQSDASNARVYNGTDTRAVQLLAGCALATFPRNWNVPAPFALASMAALAVATLFVGFESDFYRNAGIPLAAGLAGCIVIFAARDHTWLTAALRWRIVQWGGSRSYALYLWHLPVLDLSFYWADSFGYKPRFAILGALLVTCLMGEFSLRFIERPARRLRRN